MRALDSQTLSTTATCFQCHGDGRRAGLKIRSSQEGVGSSPTFGTTNLRLITNLPNCPTFSSIERFDESSQFANAQRLHHFGSGDDRGASFAQYFDSLIDRAGPSTGEEVGPDDSRCASNRSCNARTPCRWPIPRR